MKAEEKKIDPLLHRFVFPYEALFHPYGFPLLIRTNDERVLSAAATGFSGFPPLTGHEPVRLDVAITGSADGPFPPPPAIRSQNHLLWFVSDSEHFGTCDFESGVAVAWLTPKVFSNPAHLRFHFLESLGLCLIAERHLASIHAACLGFRGCGVLLWGASGAGKSTLAYALAKRGWTYTSDDGSFLIVNSTDNTVSGNPSRIRFRPSAVELFPELDGILPVERPTGKPTLEVRTAALSLPSTAHFLPVQHIVFLNRQSGAAAHLQPFPKEEARSLLTSGYHYGRAATEIAKREAVGRVLEGGIWQLTYSGLTPAVELLESLAQS